MNSFPLFLILIVFISNSLSFSYNQEMDGNSGGTVGFQRQENNRLVDDGTNSKQNAKNFETLEGIFN